MNVDELKMRVCAAIDAYRERTLALGEDIFRHPELGFKEKRTAAIVDGELSRLGIPHETGLAVTGIKGRLRGRNHTITAAVLGELDAVICRDHPAADCETGAAHCCGHFGQTATMLAVAAGFAQSGVMDELDGDLVLMATPAEEYVELEYRHHLQTAGDIGFFGGKQELIRVGAFDDVDMAMMVHAESAHPQAGFMVGGSGAGFVGKRVRYIGREAHAGGMPHEGINALNAAMIGLMSIHAQRETFKDQDAIRVHPIITKGGDLVNIVPADVRMETYVRGRTLDAILDANVKVNRALSAGAMAVGAEIEIEEVPGYLPMANDPGLDGVFRRNAEVLVGRENVKEAGFSAVSGDIGDLMHIMPAIIPSCGGFQGRAHARDFAVSDPEAAYILPAKAMAMTVIDLLADGAALGRKVKSDYHPAFTRSEYLSFWEKFTN